MTKPWHRPPIIEPNYGRRKPIIPRSSLPQVNGAYFFDFSVSLIVSSLWQVLLFDNVSQEKLLEEHLSALSTDLQKHLGLLDQRRKTFLREQSARLDKHQRMERRYNLPPARGRTPRSSTPSWRPIKSAQFAQRPSSMGVQFLTHDFLKLMRSRSAADVVADHRFSALEGSLKVLGQPCGGYLQLSSSGRSVLERYADTPQFDQSAMRRLSKQYEGVDKSKYTWRGRDKGDWTVWRF